MEKIKNAFKPDAQKEAEARKAAEASGTTEQGDYSTTGQSDYTTTEQRDYTSTTEQRDYVATEQRDYTTTSSTAGTSSSVPQPNPVSSSDLEAQPTTSTGTGGGLVEPTEAKYGATPGHGFSSYQAEPSTTTTSGYSTGAGETSTSMYSTNAPQIGSSNAPQIGKPDFGESVTAGLGTGAGTTATSGTTYPSTTTATTSSTTRETSVPDTTSVGQNAYAVGSHPTFTGNRLDPAFQDSSTIPDVIPGAAIGTGVAATGAAGTAGAYEYSQSRGVTDNTQPSYGTTTGAGSTGIMGTSASGTTEIRDNTGVTHGTEQFPEKRSTLSKLVHRDNPNKLQKEPPEGYSTTGTTATTGTAVAGTSAAAATTAPTTSDAYTTTIREPRTTATTDTSTSSPYVKPAAHQTFVRPGPYHEQHIGVDGPIGRPMEVSGAHGTDARRTSTAAEIDKSLDPSNPALLRPEEREPTLTERQASLGEGRVIDPTTGLVKNVGKYGTGAGGTDGSTQIPGYDSMTQAERLKYHDEQRMANKETTWEKIKDADVPY